MASSPKVTFRTASVANSGVTGNTTAPITIPIEPATVDYHPDEITNQVQRLMDVQRFPAAGFTPAALNFVAQSLTRLQRYFLSLDSTAMVTLRWGLADETAALVRSIIFTGTLSDSRGEVVNDFLQETLLKLPYYRDDQQRRTGGPIPVFAVVDLWAKFGDTLKWMGYQQGLPVTISGWFYPNTDAGSPRGPRRANSSSNIVASEELVGGILKLFALAYPSASPPLRISIYGIPIELSELRHGGGIGNGAASTGTRYILTFDDRSTVNVDSAVFLQGFLSAALWLELSPTLYLSSISDRQGRRYRILKL